MQTTHFLIGSAKTDGSGWLVTPGLDGRRHHFDSFVPEASGVCSGSMHQTRRSRHRWRLMPDANVNHDSNRYYVRPGGMHVDLFPPRCKNKVYCCFQQRLPEQCKKHIKGLALRKTLARMMLLASTRRAGILVLAHTDNTTTDLSFLHGLLRRLGTMPEAVRRLVILFV